MKTILTSKAKQQIRQTAKYILKQFGKRHKDKLLREVRHVRNLIADNPSMGSIEPLLAERVTIYRSLVVNKLNKMIYYIDKDTIFIVDLWDTRREPIAQANQVKDYNGSIDSTD